MIFHLTIIVIFRIIDNIFNRIQNTGDPFHLWFSIYDLWLSLCLWVSVPLCLRNKLKKQTQFTKIQTCLFGFIGGSVFFQKCPKVHRNLQKCRKFHKTMSIIRILYLVLCISTKNLIAHSEKQSQFSSLCYVNVHSCSLVVLPEKTNPIFRKKEHM